MTKKMTHEQYVQCLKSINPNVIPLEEFQGITKRIRHKYVNCGHEAIIPPNSPLHGYGCNICAKKNGGKRFQKTHQQYIEELQEVNPNVVPLEEYTKARTKIKHKCLIDGHVWDVAPTSILRGHGCPMCAKNIMLTHEQFLSLLEPIKYPNVIVVGTYRGKKNKILCKCKDCGYEWHASPDVLLRGNGCRLCGRKRFGKSCRKSHEDFIDAVKEISPTIKILGRYRTAKDRINCRCLICGYEWSPFADDLSMGKGCPICCLSHGEKEIGKILQVANIPFVPQKSFDGLFGLGGGLLSYDFYLPLNNLLIEFQGEQHERPTFGQEQFQIQQEHDRRKRDYAKQHNLKLLEIWYYDYDNIEIILKNNLNLLSVETTGIV